MLELIVSDMDGTLLDSSIKVHPDNISTIMHTYSKGIPFIVCTGRNFTEAKVLLDEAGIRCPIIGLNGAILFDRDGNVEYEVGLPNDIAMKIIAKGEQYGYYTEAMTSKNVYSSSKADRIVAISELISKQNPELSPEECRQRATQSHEVKTIAYRDNLRDLITDEHQQILKITFLHPDGQKVLRPFGEELETELPGIYVTSSFTSNIEISHERATKGEAVLAYCREHGYHPEHILTVGDNYNDITMLEIAGYSFAMGNAEEAVKQTAKYETDTNYNGGVSKAIKKILTQTHNE